jgi:hypothetical protein
MPSFSEVSFAEISIAGGIGSPPTNNLALWLNASAGLTLSGTDVSTWADQSGNGKDATASGTARPTYQSSGINGMPAISFNGTTNRMTGSAVLTARPATIFAVVNFSVSQNIGAIFQQTNFILYRGFNGGASTEFRLFNGTDLTSSNTIPNNTPVLLEAIANGASSTLFSNGVQRASGNAGTSAISDGYELASFSGSPRTIVIAEIIVYNTNLGASDRQLVEDYLNTKYSIY